MASLLDRLKGLVTKNNQATHEQFNRAIYNYLGDTLVWNPENDDTYINKGYRYNATVYSIINLITKSAAVIPFSVYEVKSENELKRYKAMTSGSYNDTVMHKSSLMRKSALIELDDTELHELLNRPNPAQSYNSWIQEVIAFGKLTGNRYIYGIGPETGAKKDKYNELYVLPSQNVEIHSGGIMQPVKEYTLSYNGTYRIPAECIMHIKDFNPYYDGTGSHLYGMSPLKAGLRVLQTNNEAVVTGMKYLQNQSARGILMSEEGDINEMQAKQLKQKFKEQYQNENARGDVMITPKKLSWINFGLSAADLSLIEQYNASVKDLANIYQVPVQLLNNTDSASYNNMKEAKKALYQNAIIPELVKIREELNRWLTPKYGEKLYIDFDFSVIPELQEEMDKVVGQMSQAWWLTPNEKREAMSYGMDDDTALMNDYYVPSSLIPLANEPDLSDEILLAASKRPEPVAAPEPEDDPEDEVTKAQSYSDYPQGATNNARRMLEWREKYGRDVVDAGTRTGWIRAQQIANREPLSLDVVKRIHSFLSRHKDNAAIDPEYRDEPYRDKGYVAYNLWGGKAMVAWAKKIAEND